MTTRALPAAGDAMLDASDLFPRRASSVLIPEDEFMCAYLDVCEVMRDALAKYAHSVTAKQVAKRAAVATAYQQIEHILETGRARLGASVARKARRSTRRKS